MKINKISNTMHVIQTVGYFERFEAVKFLQSMFVNMLAAGIISFLVGLKIYKKLKL